jgi:hypothetical protein
LARGIVALWLLEVVQVAAQLVTLGILIGLSFKVDRIPTRRLIDRDERFRRD